MALVAAAGRILLASIPVIISLYSTKYKMEDQVTSFKDYTQDFSLPTKQTYDFIIVGGGTSGCILATRLSKYFSVLVLEAGSPPPPIVEVPGVAPAIMELPEINFRFLTTPQANIGRDRHGVLLTTAGKMLGGSGSHNHASWERGNPQDYDRWAALSQDDTWKFENIQKYFKKIEKPTHKTLAGNKESGHIELIESSLSLGTDLWLQAGKELGYKIRDPQLPQSVGFNRIMYSSLEGSRASTYSAYLKLVMKKRGERLHVFSYSYVSRIIFENQTAVGVEYERHGVAGAAFASKEVILSAGAMMSPIILLKSGIGPKDQIKAAKALVTIANLPVGRNLHDHTITTIQPIYVNDPKLAWGTEANLTYGDIANFKMKRKGPLTTTYHGTEAFILSDTMKRIQMDSTISSSNGSRWGARDLNDWPDLQVIYSPTGQEPSSVSGVIFHSRPTSRGILTVNASATGFDDNNLPLLDYNYLQDPNDADVIVEGIKFFLKVIEETKTFKKIGARLGTKPHEPCKGHKFRSTEYWKCYIRHTSTGGFHTSGTCRMGHGPSDPMAVVDSKLKVIGVKRLRVVDASIMPHVTSSNTYAPTMVIAEKAADEILKSHPLSRIPSIR